MCLYNRAVVTRPQHPIFHGPLPVDLKIDTTPTPPGYFEWAFLKPCPKTLPTVAILKEEGYPPSPEELRKNPPKPDDLKEMGIVTGDTGFSDSPDTEWIAGGIHMKGVDYFSIGRQGHFLQWGFHGSPDEMTEAGRNIFLNAVYYISTFKNAGVVALRDQEPRDDLALTLGFLDTAYKDRTDQVLKREFGDDVPPQAKESRDARRAWYLSIRPYLYHEGDPWTGRFVIDQDAKALGIPNYDVKLLERCVSDLEHGTEVARADRLLARYTEEDFTTPAKWRSWLNANEKRLFFSDTFGYKFRLDSPIGAATPASAPRPGDAARAVTFSLMAYGDKGVVRGSLTVKIAPEFHIYAPHTPQPGMTGFAIRLPKGSPFTFAKEPALPNPRTGEITGFFTLPIELKGAGDRVAVLVDYQACTEQFCLPPVTDKEVAFDMRRR
jgi:hypothetical protein